MSVIDLTGKRFGRLAVIDRAGSCSRGDALWQCRCDCSAIVTVRGYGLRSGKTKSCGCLQIDVQRGRLMAMNVARRGLPRPERRIPNPSYNTAHKRVGYIRGAASLNKCVDCDRTAEDWSYNHTDPAPLTDMQLGYAYSGDPKHYVPRCKSCHRAFDNHRTPPSVDGVNHDALKKNTNTQKVS